MRLVLLDNGLQNGHGHHLNYCEGVYHVLKSSGISFQAIAHRDFDKALLGIPATLVQPYFLFSPYFKFNPGQSEQAVSHLDNEFTKVFRLFGAESIYFLPNARLLELRALLKATRSPEFSSFKLRVLMRYSYDFSEKHVENNDGFNYTGLERRFEVLRAISLLARQAEESYFFSDTQSIVKLVSQVTAKVGILGFPQRLPWEHLGYNDTYDFCYLGQYSPYKGFNTIIEALRLGAAVGFKPRVFIQCAGLAEGTFRLLKADSTLSHVTFHKGSLGTIEYFKIITDSRYVLNLYNPNVYDLGSSGVLLEALALRRHVISSSYPWANELLGTEYVKKNAVSFSDSENLLKVLLTKYAFYPDVTFELMTAWDNGYKKYDPLDFHKRLIHPFEYL